MIGAYEYLFLSLKTFMKVENCPSAKTSYPNTANTVIAILNNAFFNGAKRRDCRGQKPTPTFRDRDVAPTKLRTQFAPTRKSSVNSVANIIGMGRALCILYSSIFNWSEATISAVNNGWVERHFAFCTLQSSMERSAVSSAIKKCRVV